MLPMKTGLPHPGPAPGALPHPGGDQAAVRRLPRAAAEAGRPPHLAALPDQNAMNVLWIIASPAGLLPILLLHGYGLCS
jgi:hypothetical protein